MKQRLFLTLLLGIGLVFLFIGIKTLSSSLAASKWSVTSGIITQSEIIRSSGSEQSVYLPRISYVYWVKDTKYIGSRIAFGLDFFNFGLSNSYKKSSLFTARYQKETIIKVFYDPASPGNSVLVVGLTKYSISSLIFGSGIVLFSIWMFLLLWLTTIRIDDSNWMRQGSAINI
ncbi:MAG: DUF3592 domain-containing protein [Chthoniobacterales bacterium]|nr:DUF3592 domain-containing protein [Chthoniobacterales bacterium]